MGLVIGFPFSPLEATDDFQPKIGHLFLRAQGRQGAPAGVEPSGDQPPADENLRGGAKILGVPSPILSRDPNLSRKPPLKPREKTDPVFGKSGSFRTPETEGKRLRWLKRTMVEKNGESTPREIPSSSTATSSQNPNSKPDSGG